MKASVELLVPFLLPESSITHQAIDVLLKKKALPSLKRILSTGKIVQIDKGSHQNLACAHENYLVDRLGYPQAKNAKIAPFLFLSDLKKSRNHSNYLKIFKTQATYEELLKFTKKLFDSETYCACIEPCTIQPTPLGATLIIGNKNTNIDKLYKLACPLLQKEGLDVLMLTPERWFIFAKEEQKYSQPSFNALSNLESGSVLRLHGKNCQTFFPVDNSTGLPIKKQKNDQNNFDDINNYNSSYKRRSQWWLKLQNEIAIAWQQTDVKRGNYHFNAMTTPWLYGAAKLPSPENYFSGEFKKKERDRRFSSIFSQQSLTKGLAIASYIPYHPLYQNWQIIENCIKNRGNHLIEFDDFLMTRMDADLITWQKSIEKLETQWIKPLLFSLRMGKLSSVTLIFTNTLNTLKITMNRWQSLYFWSSQKIKSSEDLESIMDLQKTSYCNHEKQ